MLSLRRLCFKEGSQKGRKEVASLTERKIRLLAAVIIHHSLSIPQLRNGKIHLIPFTSP